MKRDIKAIVIFGAFIALFVMPFNDAIIAAALPGGISEVKPSLFSPLNLVIPPQDSTPPSDNPPANITVSAPLDSTIPIDLNSGNNSEVDTLPTDTTPPSSTPPARGSDINPASTPIIPVSNNSSPDPVPITVLKEPSSGSNTTTDTRTPPTNKTSINTDTTRPTNATTDSSSSNDAKSTKKPSTKPTNNNVVGNITEVPNNIEPNAQTCPPANETALLNKPQSCSFQTKSEPVIPEPPTYLFGMMLVGLLIFYLVKSLSTAAEIKKKEKNFESNLKESMRKKLILSRASSYKNLLKLAMGQIGSSKELNMEELRKTSARIELIGSSEMRKLSSSLNKVIFDPSKKSQLGKIVEQLSNQIKKES